ncbi:hypothetical protein X798_01118 [Onchocerca flexuosa]|uniref:Uncharacterized protein n=1 Tax=Onchocerca flexuosa TaxID=387005 RepID=A0A238C3B1_9BILA|nr:hypothetical protein X798_01118 [Onchocerca flexuosa]
MSLDANFLRLVEVRQNDDHTSSLWTRARLKSGLLIGVLDKEGENDANALLLLKLIRPLSNSGSNFNILVRSVQQKEIRKGNGGCSGAGCLDSQICFQTSREIEINERLVADRRIEIEQNFHDNANDNDDDDDEDTVAENYSHTQRRSLPKPTSSSISPPPSPSSSLSSSSSSISSSSSSPPSSLLLSSTTKTAEIVIAQPAITTTSNSSSTDDIAVNSIAPQQLRQQQQYPER